MRLYNINRKILNWCQRRNNKLYEKKGLTDKVLENQLRLNKIRNEKDISDNEHIIHEEGYVQ